MNFSWNITFGQIVITIPLLWTLYMLIKIYSMMLMFRMEHEILMVDWAKRNNVELHTIPTRQKKWW